ncbi:MAG TPA: GNAT family N-acetyltransferase [Thermoplasmatales archaeon]|nr:GNAT family N-acetyltransferase [Thermoplasmatales archaeon]
MHIRRGTREDASCIARHNRALAAESEGYTVDAATALEGVTALLDSPEKGFYLVAEEEGQVVGQLMVTFEWSDWRARDIWWLQSVYVQPAWRRRGVMRSLFDQARRLAARHHVPALRLYVHQSNRSAIEAYRRLGMEHLPYHMFSLPVEHEQ